MALTLSSLLLTGCGGSGGQLPVLPDNALQVPIVRQSTGYTCGAAVLLAVLYYWQVYKGNESGLLAVAGTSPTEGTTPQGIVRGAQKYGLAAEYREMTTIEDLRAALAEGKTVILDIQAWPDKPGEMTWAERRENGHYVVLTAMDKAYAYLMDPTIGTGYTCIRLPELMERWHDYENLKSGVWNTKHLAIFISGKNHLQKYPAPLIFTE